LWFLDHFYAILYHCDFGPWRVKNGGGFIKSHKSYEITQRKPLNLKDAHQVTQF
jgi:hypothetical protein